MKNDSIIQAIPISHPLARERLQEYFAQLAEELGVRHGVDPARIQSDLERRVKIGYRNGRRTIMRRVCPRKQGQKPCRKDLLALLEKQAAAKQDDRLEGMLRRYLRQLAVYIAGEVNKSRRPAQLPNNSDPEDGTPTPVYSDEAKAWAAERFAALSPLDRRIMMGVFVDGETRVAVAEREGLSRDQVGRRLKWLLTDLRQQYEAAMF
ncbi:MAG: hypothetical protein R3B57_01660 [Phycisphaerales bacterium]